MRASMPSQGHRPPRQDRANGVGRRGHVRVAEHDQHGRGRDPYQPDGGLKDHGQGALAAGQGPGQVAAPLRQQVLQLVAGVLAGEAAELGPDGGQVGPDHLLQPRDGGGAARAGPQALAGATDHLQLQDVVGGAAVGQGPRPAGVVADHPAQGAAAVGRRVGAEAQPVGPGRRLEVVEHHARLDRGRGPLRVQRQHPPEVPAQVHDHAGTDGVAGDRGAGAPGRHRDAQLEAGGHDGLDLVGVAREGDQLGRHPVQRGVGRVLGPPPRGRVDLGHPGPPQGRGQLRGQVPDPSASLPGTPPGRGLGAVPALAGQLVDRHLTPPTSWTASGTGWRPRRPRSPGAVPCRAAAAASWCPRPGRRRRPRRSRRRRSRWGCRRRA